MILCALRTIMPAARHPSADVHSPHKIDFDLNFLKSGTFFAERVGTFANCFAAKPNTRLNTFHFEKVLATSFSNFNKTLISMNAQRPLKLTIAVLCAVFTVSAFGQTATTDPVGFISDQIPANSEAAVSAPMTRPISYRGSIKSISGNVITVSGSPNWATSPKQFVPSPPTQTNSFYVQLAKGNKAGLYAAIVDNGTNTLSVQLNPGDNLSGILTEDVAGVANADTLALIPFWTPATLFPSSWPNGTDVLFFDSNIAGINQAASQILTFVNGVWFDAATGDTATDLLIHPLDPFKILNRSSQPISRVNVGNVPIFKHRLLVSTIQANTAQDNRIAYASPAPEVIGTTGLGFSSGDQLLIFDNAALGQNKAASQVLDFVGSQWFDGATGDNVTNTFSLQPGAHYVYRKAGTSSPTDIVWSDLQSYNQ